jgi:hypothetical protein
LHQTGNIEAARHCYGVAVSLAPSLTLYNNYAACLAMLKDVQELRVIYQYAIEVSCFCANERQPYDKHR